MSPPLFKDFGKPSKDLIGKNYPTSKKAVLKTKTENGVSFQADISKADEITGAFTPKYSCDKYGLTIEQTISHKDLISGEVAIVDKLGKGTKVKLTHVSNGAAPSVGGSIEYKHDKGNVVVDVAYPLCDKAPSTSITGVVGKDAISAGFSVKANPKEGSLSSVDAGLNYSKGKYSIAAVGQAIAPQNQSRSASVFSHYKVDDKINVAATSTVIMEGAGKSIMERVEFTVGGTYKPDGESTFRAKANSSGVIGLSWSNQLNKYADLTLAAMIDSTHKSNAKLGFELTFDA